MNVLLALLADTQTKGVSGSTLWTILIILAIIALVVVIFHFARR